ncbi:MAG: hypothetical protein R3284_10670, partial [Rubricoccaceae bacterium]|nr:hypothetical protein [Rubricoccaceae bacterium]
MRFPRVLFTPFFGLLLLLATPGSVAGQGYTTPQPGLADQTEQTPEVSIEEHLGDTISLDTPFVTSTGEEVTLGDYFGKDHPVVLVFAYHSCPMLCSLILDGTAQALQETELVAGDDFEV